MRRFGTMMVLALAAGLCAPALGQQQTDQPSQDKKPHVFTNDDLSKPSDSNSDATPAASDQDKDQGQGQDKDATATAAADPNDKRTDVQKAQDEVKKWTHEEESLNRKLQRVQQQEADTQDEFRKQMFRDAYNNQQTTLQEIRQKKDAAQKDLDAAQEKEKEAGGGNNSQGAQQQAPAEQQPQEQPPQ